ncbi:hypothetical protein Hanom_Chr04g00283591 [Helianthus anomalus]
MATGQHHHHLPSGGDEDDDGGAEVYGPSAVSQGLRWRNLVYNLKLKSKSFKMFSMKSLGMRHEDDMAVVDGGDWTVAKPSCQNFTFEELVAATESPA